MLPYLLRAGRWITCGHCGAEARHQAHGLCHACYEYRHKYGRPRPLTYPTHCCVCRRALPRKGTNGAICGACYMAAYRRGMLAPDIYHAVEENAS